MDDIPRVALFADTFHETNGAANIMRRLTDYAKLNRLPFLCIRAGPETRYWMDGRIQILELKRSRAAFTLNEDLKYDPLLWRHRILVKQALLNCRSEVLHLTGVNDISQLGFAFAHFSGLPAVASWHTNAHEYLSQRILSHLSFLPCSLQSKLDRYIKGAALKGVMKVYFLAQVQMAPNVELLREIQRMTGRPTFLLERGVDPELFAPEKRKRTDNVFNLGFVGRLRPEKNVRFLATVDAALRALDLKDYRFVVVGEGSESEWLKQNVNNLHLTGVLHGEELARTYANMDLFLFPSKTDAFGNATLEAMASGVPSVVMPQGGPRFLVEHEKDGFISTGDEDFCEIVTQAVGEPERLQAMRKNARRSVFKYSWNDIFNRIYENYRFSTTVKKNVRAGS